MRITATVNGEPQTVDDVWPGESLLYVLRERMGLPGSKNACEQGECGSCTVYLDSVAVCACLVAAGQAEGREVVTVEGLADGDALHPVQQCFVEADAVQCGFCTPGLVVATHDLLARAPAPLRSGDPRGARRQPVPVHRLREDPGRGASGGAAVGHAMTLILDGCAIVTMDDERHEHSSGHIAIDGNRITSVGAGAVPAAPDSTVIDARGCLVTPGLVNTHHHLYQTLTRARAQDATLFEWLLELYPVWARIDAEAEYAAARTGLAELALSGCTTVSDHHYVFPRGRTGLLEAEVQAARELGLRFVASRGSMDLGAPTAACRRTRSSRRSTPSSPTSAARRPLHDPARDARVQIAVAPCSPFSVTRG